MLSTIPTYFVADQFITRQHPHALFGCPQIGGLSHKGRAMHLAKTWEEMDGVFWEEGTKHFI
jgi:hypothetical protein